MNITINQKVAHSLFASAARIASTKSHVPILANIKILVKDGRLTVTANNLNMESHISSECDVTSEGEITAPAAQMASILGKLRPKEPVTISLSGKNDDLQIMSGRSSFILKTLPAGDYPEMNPTTDENAVIKIDAKKLGEMFHNTVFCVSTEETRYYLNGICIHTKEIEDSDQRMLVLVATDGHKLAYSEMPGLFPEMERAIVPLYACTEIMKILGSIKGDAEIVMNTSSVSIESENISFTSKLIDAEFPDYSRVIPKTGNHPIKIVGKVFKETLDRVNVISSEKGHAMKITASALNVLINVDNPNAGSAEEEIKAEYDGPGATIGVNAKYMAAVSAACGDGEMTIHLGDGTSPMRIENAGRPGDLYIVMPMRV